MPQKILFVYPSSSPDLLEGEVDFDRYKTVPIGVLSIATYLTTKGYQVEIVDGRPLPKRETWRRVEAALGDSLLVCIGANTVQLKHGIAIADAIKEKYPSKPILFGGIHAIMFPTQTVEDKSVDYVAYGEAEQTVFELVEYLAKQKGTLAGIKGLAYKESGKVIINQPAPPIDPNTLPIPNYELLALEPYIQRDFMTNLGKIRKMRGIDISTSRGCPYKCNFCPMTMDTFKGYRSLELEKVFTLMDYLIPKYNIEHIWFTDELFFANRKKVEAICQHIIEKGYKLTWESNARVDQFREGLLDDTLLAILKKSGCYALRMGMESGSNRILELMKKGCTADRIEHAVKQCEKYGIIPVGNFICGFPTETKEEVLESAKMILRLKHISPNGLFYSPGLLRPYPGTEMYEICKEYGEYDEPKTLREWANKKIDIGLFATPHDLKWIKDPDWLLNFQVYFYIVTVMKTHELTGEKLSPAWKLFAKIAEKRINSNYWKFGVEPKMLITAKKFLDKNNKPAKMVKKVLSL